MNTADASVAHHGPPDHQPGHGQLVGVIVLASMEVRHAGQAVWEHFSTCGSLFDFAERIMNLDEATFVGVIAFAVIFGLFVADWVKIAAGELSKWLGWIRLPPHS